MVLRDVLYDTADRRHAFFDRWFVENNVRQGRTFWTSIDNGRRRVLSQNSLLVILADQTVTDEQYRGQGNSANHCQEFEFIRIPLAGDGFFRVKWVVDHEYLVQVSP